MVSFSSRFLAFYTIADHRIGWSNFDQERIVDRIYKIVRVPAGAFLMGNYEYDDAGGPGSFCAGLLDVHVCGDVSGIRRILPCLQQEKAR